MRQWHASSLSEPFTKQYVDFNGRVGAESFRFQAPSDLSRTLHASQPRTHSPITPSPSRADRENERADKIEHQQEQRSGPCLLGSKCPALIRPSVDHGNWIPGSICVCSLRTACRSLGFR